MNDCDLCVVGSGAGGGPLAWAAARAGKSVVVLEKGPWLTEKDFAKDEIAQCRRRWAKPDERAEPHVVAFDADGDAWPTHETSWDFWNGSLVGGSSNLMAGYFHRLKPTDFRLRSEYGPIEGASVADWPIAYEDLEPYYAKVEAVVGVSGKVVPHPALEPRSTPDFPFPALVEHPAAGWLEEAAREEGLHPFPVPRAVLSAARGARRGCEYSGYCGSYGCTSGAKGSARAALLDDAVATGRCEIRPGCTASRVVTDATGRATHVEYFDPKGEKRTIRAGAVVIACQAIQSARLLLLSAGPKHPDGLGNGAGMVGKHLLFSAGGVGVGVLTRERFGDALMGPMPWINRALQDGYELTLGGRRLKGGTIDFLWRHPNPIRRALRAAWTKDGPLWGEAYKERLLTAFREERELLFEVFVDWLSTPGCRVTLDPSVKDRFGLPVARVHLASHPHDLKVGAPLMEMGKRVVKRLGAERIRGEVSWGPSTNLVAGGARFGRDPATSVLDADCRVHGAENVYVTDGSFMPTGGSVPYTWTIYANALRVADRMGLRT